MCRLKNLAVRTPLKTSLFPVHRVAIIVASREAAKSFFLIHFFSLYRNDVQNAEKKDNLGNVKKKCIHSALISSPGRWTGNKIIFKGGLI